MLRRIFPHPLLSFILWFIWLLLNNTVDPAHMILGAVLAIFIPWFTSAFWPEKVRIRRPWLLVKYIVIVLYEILVANVIVAKLILSRQDKLQPGFLHIPLELESPIAIAILANTISLTPGTVTCDLSDDRRSLLVHALHVEDPQATVQEIKQMFEKPLQEIFS
ncbi:Na+/H+ antiporter subunit E [Methylophaga sp. OBS4]|uniref:Na+/H+ antiporter subunit E n=1 Tax=Methylophaga sp. OBS4 TaxID=2991935 RepID=UPI00225B3C95|nr:Na+/H+ antiporter subunit E [Methylophaga sp. OBS4]MCX4186680.1 Na+/H+ antiporter subunit E [Methylophaga sp. OBS4]